MRLGQIGPGKLYFYSRLFISPPGRTFPRAYLLAIITLRAIFAYISTKQRLSLSLSLSLSFPRARASARFSLPKEKLFLCKNSMIKRLAETAAEAVRNCVEISGRLAGKYGDHRRNETRRNPITREIRPSRGSERRNQRTNYSRRVNAADRVDECQPRSCENRHVDVSDKHVSTI